MVTNKEKRYFSIADSVSQLSNHPKAKLGCIIVNGKQIVSSGYNSDTKTHPLQKAYNKHRFSGDYPAKVHAELEALLPLINNRTDLSKATLYISRKHKDGSIAIARPCPSCMALIKSCGIKTIHYTTHDGYAKEVIK